MKLFDPGGVVYCVAIICYRYSSIDRFIGLFLSAYPFMDMRDFRERLVNPPKQPLSLNLLAMAFRHAQRPARLLDI